jgi:hypothetical protein
MIDYARYFRLSFWLWFYKIKAGLKAMFKKDMKIAVIVDKPKKEMMPIKSDPIYNYKYVVFSDYVPCSPNKRGLQQRSKRTNKLHCRKKAKQRFRRKHKRN